MGSVGAADTTACRACRTKGADRPKNVDKRNDEIKYFLYDDMSRILGIDFGVKRCGLSTTDPLRIAVHGLETIERKDLDSFIKTYLKNESVEYIVIGDGKHGDGEDSYVTTEIRKFISDFSKEYPNVRFEMVNEAFTSAEAQQILIRSGAKKKKRRDKRNLDKISAVLILQRHLGHI